MSKQKMRGPMGGGPMGGMGRGGEKAKDFKKTMKTYVGCLMAFFLFYILQRLTWIIKTTYWSQFSTKQWIESMTLVGYFTGHGDVINGTTWFLIPLFLF